MDFSNTHLIKGNTTSGCSKDEEESSNISLNRFLELPEDVIRSILHRLGVQEILESAERVCSSWRKICKDPSMWRVIDMKHPCGEDEYLEAMCARAVDRSQGQVTEIHIDVFATDELLRFISERSSQLRCLRIRNCNGVGDDGLISLAKKCPLLEDLHFVGLSDVHNSIEPIGHSCPNLSSFTLSYCDTIFQDPYERDNNFEARAIAKSMPSLRHLRVVENMMTNMGLEAILDGCPNLDSLDIRKCYNVDLHGEIGRRIAQKIKYFKRPDDPMELCDWEAGICYYYEDEYEEEYEEEEGHGRAYFDSFGYSSDGW